jgi:DNA-directed RNA polymerase
MDNATDLLTQQVIREDKMFSDGLKRYTNRQLQNKRPSTSDTPHYLVTNSLPLVSEGMQEWLMYQKNLGGRRQDAYSILSTLDCDLIAYIGLNTCMDGTASGGTRTAVITNIGKRIELEIWAAGLKDFNPKIAKKIESHKSVKEQSVHYYKVRALKKVAKRYEYDVEPWSDSLVCHVGSRVLSVVLDRSQLFEDWTKNTTKKTTKMVGLTDEASQRLADLDVKAAWQEPMLSPMIMPPKDYEDFDTGCYHSAVAAAMVPLVRQAGYAQKKAIKHDIAKAKAKGEIPEYMEALNILQSTPLTINAYVKDAVKWCWDNGYTSDLKAKAIKKFPVKEMLKFKSRPENYNDLSLADQILHKQDNNKIRAKNLEVKGGIALMSQDLSTADEIATYDQFYIPWNLDFRGRVYPVSNFSYHRDDHIKAMFLLKNTKAMDDDAAFWLAVHIANNGDFNRVSKKSFEARAEWVERRKMLIYAIGRDFKKTYRIWSKADKPFQFLAACHEFANYMDYGNEYHCGLPIGLDASCSGIQHYAAASLAESDGAQVNLVPAAEPQDIYAAVAEVSRTMVLEVLKSYVPQDKISKETGKLVKDNTLLYAAAWLKMGITRDKCKRNVMTFGYSSSKYGMGIQLYDDFMKPLEDLVMRGVIDVHPFGDTEYSQKAAAHFLADINYNAVRQVTSSSAVGMKFFQRLVGELAHEGKHLRFNNPVGFPMVQNYTFWDTKKVVVYMFDRAAEVEKRTSISIRHPRPIDAAKRSKRSIVDKKKSKSSIAPNVIHSMDSAHLLKTVIKAKREGVVDFFLIHDSFATVPTDTDAMYQTVRSTFVDLYKDYCLYSDFKSQVLDVLSDAGIERLQGVEIPPKGTLDITQVLDSEYCFS